MYTRHVVRILFPLLAFLIIYTSVITFSIINYWHLGTYLDGIDIFHSLMGIVLSLFLVFRTNTAYDRWWEGRKIWGALINDTRAFAMKLRSMIASPDDRFFYAYMISNFCFAMKEYLREGVRVDELFLEKEPEKKRIEQAKNVPNCIGLMMYEKLIERHRAGEISGEQLLVLDKEIKGFIDHLGACERIKKTPIPYSYSMFIKKLIFIFSLTLPFAFVRFMGYWSVIVVVIVSYVLVSIALISEEIEDPFGKDVNDLPLENMCLLIKTNVRELLCETEGQ